MPSRTKTPHKKHAASLTAISVVTATGSEQERTTEDVSHSFYMSSHCSRLLRSSMNCLCSFLRGRPWLFLRSRRYPQKMTVRASEIICASSSCVLLDCGLNVGAFLVLVQTPYFCGYSRPSDARFVRSLLRQILRNLPKQIHHSHIKNIFPIVFFCPFFKFQAEWAAR